MNSKRSNSEIVPLNDEEIMNIPVIMFAAAPYQTGGFDKDLESGGVTFDVIIYI